MNLKSIVPVLCIVILMTSCHRHGTMTIVVRNGSYHMEIVRRGSVQFTADTTAINTLSPHGYISFIKNNKRLRAEYDEKEGVYMEIYENDKLLPKGEGKEFLAEAVKEMVERNVGSIYNKD
jgi:PBP1b-binding outer membrane lipoprotein LpoB